MEVLTEQSVYIFLRGNGRGWTASRSILLRKATVRACLPLSFVHTLGPPIGA